MVKNTISKKITAALLAVLMTALTACGSEIVDTDSEVVELIDPVGISYNYEEAAIRSIISTEVSGAYIVPAIYEYSVETGQSFNAYDVYPGGEVKSGSNIFHGDTENIENQIKEKKKYINSLTENYEEQKKELEEKIADLIPQEKNYFQYVENILAEKPEEFIKDEKGNTVTNPEYTEWKYKKWGYDDLNMTRISLSISREKAELELEKSTKIYELDLARQKVLLNRLIADRNKYSLTSKVDGELVAIKSYSKGDNVSASSAVAAVGDMSNLQIRCEYISKSKYTKATDVYAIFNGKRYEVDYQALSTEEYSKINETNGKVYSTFTFAGAADDITVGQYGVIVRENSRTENVVTVPKDAVKKDEGISYVYLLEDGVMVYTVVTTGVKDGEYIEITSGVKEGDKVITENAVKTTTNTVTLSKGTTKAEFSATGYFTYPASEWITNPVEYGTSYLVDTDLQIYQHVTKGEVIATIRVVPDELSLERNQKQLERAKERLEDYKKENKDALAKDPEKDSSVKYVHQYVSNQEESIAELQKTIDKMISDSKITEITAPMDGIIVDSGWAEKGSLMYSGQRLFKIADQTASYIVVEDNNGQLNYGDRAKIKYNDNEGKEQYGYGTVVTVNHNMVSKGLQDSYSLIKIDEEYVGPMSDSESNMRGWWGRSNFSVTVTIREMNDVVVVPRRAVTDSNGSLYVKVKNPDGSVKRVSFVSGGMDSTNYWVIEGLTEGMEICLE